MSSEHTLVHQLAGWAEKTPDAPAIHGKVDGRWRTRTWKQYYGDVQSFAKGILAAGHQPGQAVTICANNRPEWVISQLGTIAAGGIPAPVYQTCTPQQIEHIVTNSGARIAVCENAALAENFLALRAEGKIELDAVVLMEVDGDAPEGTTTFEALLASGDDDATLEARMAALSDDGTGLFIYTSGTTGVPKGAELTHRGLTMMGASLHTDYPEIEQYGFRVVSYLPLSHIAEQIFTNFLHLKTGGEVYFCDDISKVKDALLEVHPTVFVGVPRVWEKFEVALRTKMEAATGIKAKLASWALATELACFEADLKSGTRTETFGRKMAHKLVISKIHAALGLDQLLMSASGAAPISKSTLNFFASIGIVIHEGYGMTETTGILTSTPYMKPRFGSVGTALAGVTVKIADDGEIIARGDNMTRGYFKMPEKTAELLDSDGWLHTGDLGRLDDEGYLWITGRKKDLLITAGGKNVAPSEMEQHLTGLPGIGQAVVVGDAKPYLAALLALDPENLDELRKQAGDPSASLEALSASEKVHAFLQPLVESECNAKVARYQTIKRFKILPAPFAVETGELTPSMKVKRNVVTERYTDLIEAMYAEKREKAQA